MKEGGLSPWKTARNSGDDNFFLVFPERLVGIHALTRLKTTIFLSIRDYQVVGYWNRFHIIS